MMTGYVASCPMAANHLAPTTLTTLVEATIARVSDRPALVGPGTDAITYGALAERAQALAAGLANLGIGPGDIVAAQLPNGPDFVTLYLAVTRLGAALQTLHMPYRAAELGDLLGSSGAVAAVGLGRIKDGSPAETLLGLRDRLPRLRHVVAVGEPVPGTLPLAEIPRPGTSVPDRASPDAPMLLLYTSGTTANPKGVPNRHAGFMANACASAIEFGFDERDVILSAAPFTHLYGAFTLHLALVAGAATALLPAFSPPALIEAVRAARPTAIFAAPAHFAACLSAGLVRAEDFASVRTICVSGSAVAPELAAAIEAAIPSARVVQLWGMSELQAGSYGRPNDPAELRHRTAGRPSPGTELRVVGETGAPLPAGQEGRLQMRGPSLFDGYLGNPEATASAFTAEGWFETGDTGRLGPDGSLALTGRVKEIINRGGVKYSPVDVEIAIERMPAVARAAIVPMPDPVLGERGALFVVPSGDAAPTLAEIAAHLEAAGIAKFKWPERIEVIDAMPLTPTQKIMRGRLAALLRADGGDA